MDGAAHEIPKRGVDHAVPRERKLARERRADHVRLKVNAVGTNDLDVGTRKALFDEGLDLFGLHEGAVVRAAGNDQLECRSDMLAERARARYLDTHPTTDSPLPSHDCSEIAASKLIESARRVVLTEAAALQGLASRIDAAFAKACQLILSRTGRVVTSGMGKSGHVARKIAATLASTGTPSFFVHPGEASHGDLGMITATDTVLALSYSGETEELLTILPLLQRQGIPILAMTGKPGSTLARQCDVHLDASVLSEACPLGLAPTASTTTALALGDALAIAMLEARGFTAEDFAFSHPAGSLGRRLLLRIEDVMHRDAEVPSVSSDATLIEALMEMSRKGLGMTAIVDDRRRLIGVFTDGDLRRALDSNMSDLRSTQVSSVMTRTPRTIAPHRLAGEAAQLMEQHKIQGLLVVDRDELIGAVTFLDLLRAKVV